MTTHIRQARRALAGLFLSAGAFYAGGCSLDISNPNAATEEEVLTTAAGLRGVAIGLQGLYGNALEEGRWIPGVVSGEIGTTNASQSTHREFQDFPDPASNSAIEETNPELLDFWSRHYRVVHAANDILDNIDNVQFAPGTKSGMTALAKTLKAASFGALIEAFEQIPIDIEQDNPPFVNRAAALAEVLALLQSARDDITVTAPTADFTSNILAPNFDLLNTIRALQARFSLAAGNYIDALTFAGEVPLTASSIVTYSSTDPNPLRDLLHGQRYFGAIGAFRTNAEAGDTRVDQKTTSTLLSAFGGATLYQVALYPSVTDPLPVFTQDEMSLIRAEAYARQATPNLVEAINELNDVRNRAGLGDRTIADLPTQQAVLDEIYVQRYYSLFLMGLHWADERRFGRIAEAKVNYLPYPLSERSENSNTPANP